MTDFIWATLAIIFICNIFRSGEAPRAYVVLKKDSDLTSEAIIDFVKENAAPFKHLTGGVEFLEIIPKSNSGKILRRELKDAYLSKQL